MAFCKRERETFTEIVCVFVCMRKKAVNGGKEKKSNHVDTLLLSFVIAFVIYKVSVRVQVS